MSKENYTETWIDQKDGRVRYERIIPSVPEWHFFKVELVVGRAYFDWCKAYNPNILKRYIDHAVACILKKNEIS